MIPSPVKDYDSYPKVSVTLSNGVVQVLNCNLHPRNKNIQLSLQNSGWVINAIRGDGYHINSETPQPDFVLSDLVESLRNEYK